jgi:hypothetical protein
MHTWFGLLSALLGASAMAADEVIPELSKHLARMSALVVAVCSGADGDMATVKAIVDQTPWTVFCRGAASPGMEQLRGWAREKNLLGTRVYVADDDGPSLWLAGEMVVAAWVAPGVRSPPSDQEILRVLHPRGVAVVSGRVMVKEVPRDIDEWRHPYHEPDNNVVSRDRVARLPGELRFQTFPVFAPMPDQTLIAGGRIPTNPPLSDAIIVFVPVRRHEDLVVDHGEERETGVGQQEEIGPSLSPRRRGPRRLRREQIDRQPEHEHGS